MSDPINIAGTLINVPAVTEFAGTITSDQVIKAVVDSFPDSEMFDMDRIKREMRAAHDRFGVLLTAAVTKDSVAFVSVQRELSRAEMIDVLSVALGCVAALVSKVQPVQE